jgi:hypothetical protein
MKQEEAARLLVISHSFTHMQDNLPVLIGSLTKQSEPIGGKTGIPSIHPEKGCCCRSGNTGRQAVRVWWEEK